MVVRAEIELYTRGKGGHLPYINCRLLQVWATVCNKAKSGTDEGNYNTVPMDINPSYVSGSPLKVAGFNITHQISNAHW